MTTAELFNLALQRQQSGKLREADELYRQLLQAEPKNPDALHMLGVLGYQLGRHAAAADLIRQAIQLNPKAADYHCNLALALAGKGEHIEAIAEYKKSAALDPLAHETYYNLGNSLRALERPEEAITAYQHALSLHPGHAPCHNNIAMALRAQGRHDESIQWYRRAIELDPNNFAAHNNLGNVLKDQGDFAGAIVSFRAAIKLHGKRFTTYENLSKALLSLDRREEAVSAFETAVKEMPDSAAAYNGLGLMRVINEQYDEAIAAFRQAIILNPGDHAPHNNLGHVLQIEGQIEKAIACYDRSLALKSDAALIGSNRLLAMHLLPQNDAHALFDEHRRWAERFADPLKADIAPHANDRSPERHLKIGYVSADLRDHVVGWSMLPILRCHDRAQFEVYCYTSVQRTDSLTDQLKNATDVWRSLSGLTEEQCARIIRHDEIDILVDLSLHTAGNGLLVFARKPAPVQVTYLGYASTTGLDTIDYRFSDPYLDPPDSDTTCYSEETIRLPDTNWYYQPAGQTPEVSQLPALENGYVTFGCLSNFAKVTAPAIELWMVLLKSIPKSRLLLFCPTESLKRPIKARFTAAQIDLDRLEFVPRQKFGQYMQTYQRIDIALEPFPYGGAITTCDSLWMGVPVVSLVGRTAVGRGGKSVLSNVGVPELIAATPEDYLRIAREIACDLPRLSELRRTLREKMLASPLTDAPRLTQNLERAYREMWRKWCACSS